MTQKKPSTPTQSVSNAEHTATDTSVEGNAPETLLGQPEQRLSPAELDPWAPALETLPENLTRAAIVDVAHVEYEITDAMVATACVEMESLQQFPFAARGR